MAIEISGQGPAQLSNAKTEPKTATGRSDTATSPPKQTQPSTIDTATLTDTATQLQKLEAQIAVLPVVDASRVADVKASIINGRFQTDPVRVAEKMLSFETARGRLA
jgi:negative regulator of flagellin synthesis FlgM